MKSKIRVKHVSDFCDVSKFLGWNVRLGDRFEKGDVIYTLENRRNEYKVVAEDSGVLTDQLVGESFIVESGQVIGEYISDTDGFKEYDPVGVGLISNIIKKITKK